MVSTGIQIGIELTNVFPVRQTLEFGARELLKTYRALRKSGSDFIVEEDLSNIFGRGIIHGELVTRFRSTVAIPERQTVPYLGSVLTLTTGAGPTLTRALDPHETHHMATVIQLSYLASVHDIEKLAVALSECIDKRVGMGVKNTEPSPGTDAIRGSLEACVSQTSGFNWHYYTDSVVSRLGGLITSNADRQTSLCFTPALLLACMDFLYTVQRTPEEWVIGYTGWKDGIVSLIVWAHHILNLNVVVKDSKTMQEYYFGNDIQERLPESNMFVNLFINLSFGDQTICLLDNEGKVQIKYDPQLNEDIMSMEARERVHLRGYGSIRICRLLDQSRKGFMGQPAFADAVQVTIALASLISQRLVRSLHPRTKKPLAKCHIKRSQIWDAASVVFGYPAEDFNPQGELEYDEDAVENYLQKLPPNLEFKTRKLDAIELPSALSYLIRDRVPDWGPASPKPLVTLAIMVVVLATVPDIRNCGGLPLVLEESLGEASQLEGMVVDATAANPFILLKSHTFFSELSRLLCGVELDLSSNLQTYDSQADDGRLFMISNFGWTICLPSFGDFDPFTVVSESLFVKQGVPTHTKSGERRNKVRDAMLPPVEIMASHKPDDNWVLDRGEPSYVVRCAAPVTERIEYYGTYRESFHLRVLFRGAYRGLIAREATDSMPRDWERQFSCRTLYEALWKTVTAPKCEHGDEIATLARSQTVTANLGPDAVTASGTWLWTTRVPPIPERLVVILVKGDRRARWLAINGPDFQYPIHTRNIMLRGRQSCANCALKEAAQLPGKWFIII